MRGMPPPSRVTWCLALSGWLSSTSSRSPSWAKSHCNCVAYPANGSRSWLRIGLLLWRRIRDAEGIPHVVALHQHRGSIGQHPDVALHPPHPFGFGLLILLILLTRHRALP